MELQIYEYDKAKEGDIIKIEKVFSVDSISNYIIFDTSGCVSCEYPEIIIPQLDNNITKNSNVKVINLVFEKGYFVPVEYEVM